MTTIRSMSLRGMLGILSMSVTACADSVTPVAPITGKIKVTVSTTSAGSNINPNGYTVSVDGGANQSIAINDTLTTVPLRKGAHLVRLSGIPLNCSTVATDRWVDIVTDKVIVPISFSITCSSFFTD